ncbi:hypothetical protein BCR37DRAFT_391202 [Protomyces lactucae-debilis]|uniref:Dolichyl-diphosphooligosaccharide-protein glycosyltransferase subunit OST5 n=1 Tax=Protomyces lactucae-debilis TaxID=2754530 RepID=A0A1Y2FR02_PROLT|nr:uncharacterized protein BCR37DRAFT_391202 [Protomyces lactucae-debilis]ORY86430.1 hypothetical protein BCR37DRAFT_391202 [Protomyces lactucae-debilis]
MSMSTLQDLFSQGQPYHATVPLRAQALVATVLLIAAALGSALFSISTGPKKLAVALPASLCWGFGALYLLLACGVYV